MASCSSSAEHCGGGEWGGLSFPDVSLGDLFIPPVADDLGSSRPSLLSGFGFGFGFSTSLLRRDVAATQPPAVLPIIDDANYTYSLPSLGFVNSNFLAGDGAMLDGTWNQGDNCVGFSAVSMPASEQDNSTTAEPWALPWFLDSVASSTVSEPTPQQSLPSNRCRTVRYVHA